MGAAGRPSTGPLAPFGLLTMTDVVLQTDPVDRALLRLDKSTCPCDGERTLRIGDGRSVFREERHTIYRPMTHGHPRRSGRCYGAMCRAGAEWAAGDRVCHLSGTRRCQAPDCCVPAADSTRDLPRGELTALRRKRGEPWSCTQIGATNALFGESLPNAPISDVHNPFALLQGKTIAAADSWRSRTIASASARVTSETSAGSSRSFTKVVATGGPSAIT